MFEEPPNEDVGCFKWGRFVTLPKTSIGSKAYGGFDIGASGLRQVMLGGIAWMNEEANARQSNDGALVRAVCEGTSLIENKLSLGSKQAWREFETSLVCGDKQAWQIKNKLGLRANGLGWEIETSLVVKRKQAWHCGKIGLVAEEFCCISSNSW
ncbi:hypothetical protein QYF36_013377 [Acer negundo]|nr:hypothetical protein QYF36_013377 [Acer negundo]